jgi:hypothetical protein
MIGALTFIGCPTRTVIRLAGGDLNALTGFAGIIVGVLGGVFFLRRGYDLSRVSTLSTSAGWIIPLGMVGLFMLVVFKPAIIFFSDISWGSEHAAIGISLGAGLLIGFLAQRSRICFMGAWRDIFLVRDTHLMTALVSAFIGALVLNLFLGQFNIGFVDQPHAHTNHLLNFLGTALVGLAAALLGGCPLRQLILSGEGDTDAGATLLGLFAGGAIARNFNISSCEGKVPEMGPVAVIVALIICVAIGFLMREK